MLQLVTRNGETLRVPEADLRMSDAGCWAGLHLQYALGLARLYR
jgi:hypothetical protein